MAIRRTVVCQPTFLPRRFPFVLPPRRCPTLLDYLTAPTPTPSLVHRVVTPARGQLPYFWWDVRNLRSWNDFNISTLSSINGLLRLLTVDVPESMLPAPPRVPSNPDSEYG